MVTRALSIAAMPAPTPMKSFAPLPSKSIFALLMVYSLVPVTRMPLKSSSALAM